MSNVKISLTQRVLQKVRCDRPPDSWHPFTRMSRNNAGTEKKLFIQLSAKGCMDVD